MITLMARLGRRFRVLFARRRLEREMAEEMRLHLELEAAELERAGLSADEAARRAHIAFGGVERYKEEGRDARGVRWAEDFAYDARHAVRQLRRTPGFTIAALVTLSLGIGVSTAMYSMTRVILVDPLPFENSDDLVLLSQCGDNCRRMTIGNFVTVRDESRTLDAVAAYVGWSPVLRGTERSEVLSGTRVTVELFRMTGGSALLGRRFEPNDTLMGRPRVVMISEAAWRSRFGGDSGVVGRTIMVDGQPATVIGVVPARVAFPALTDIWTLLPIDAKAAADRYWTDYTVLGRRRPGVSLPEVAAELRAIEGRLAIAFPDAMRGQHFTAKPSRAWNGDIGTQLAVFLTAVAFVLVIACTNLAGLLLARLTAREREIAVRAAMGAGGGRIARQLLTEMLMLALAGGLLGSAGAWVMIDTMRTAVPADAITGWTNLHMNLGALGVSLALGGATGALIGMGPALRFSRPDLVRALKEGVRSTGGSGSRIRRALVVAEVAFAIVLVAAAGLLTRTAVNVYKGDAGFRSDHVLTMRLRYPAYADTARRSTADLYGRLTREVERIPGVVRAATVSWVPFTGFTSFGFEIEGRPPAESGRRPWARMQAVTAGYFDAMRIPIVRGRGFTDQDGGGAPRVAIINELTARRMFVEKGEDALGRAVILEGERYEIVGIARNVLHYGVNQPPIFEIYYPQSHSARGAVALVVRTVGDPAAVSSAVTRVVTAFDRDLGINRVATMPAVADEWLARYRIVAGLMLAFAAIALLISAIGLYGIVSFAVAQRTREFGIRLALGAGPRDLLRMVLGDGARLAGVGAVLGVAGALGLTRAMRSMLYGVGPADPSVLALLVATLGALAVGASLVPARRAAAVDPMTSLRAE